MMKTKHPDPMEIELDALQLSVDLLTNRTKRATQKLERIRNRRRKNKMKMIITGVLILINFFLPYGIYYYNSMGSKPAKTDNYALEVFKPAAIRYDPNKVADYALESAGATIYGDPCAEKYTAWQISFINMHIPFSMTGTEQFILQSSMEPGQCWAFAGNQGTIKIKLSHTIIPQAVTIDHIDRNVNPTGSITSAPRHFAVFAFEEGDTTNKEFMGSFEFKLDGEPTQTFTLIPLRLVGFPARIIEFQFNSNHGHPKYTCVYKVRVHGEFFNL